MATKTTEPNPYERLQIVQNQDGTISRLLKVPQTPASTDPNLPALSKDVPLDQSKSTWMRLYLPRKALDSPSSSSKLPLILNFHGGGFILFSAASSNIHTFYSNLAVELSALFVSVEYRLAPEHRLPAAYDDAMDAIHWIKSAAGDDDWLRNYADFSNCFLMGTSAGSNIAYHAGLRFAAESRSQRFSPVKIKGLILHQPFFGGTRRTGSELRSVNDPMLPLSVIDLMWELALPIGADQDHEYCNPKVGGGSEVLKLVGLLGWRVFVGGSEGDPLVDRQKEFVKLLEEKGVEVVSCFTEGGFHGVEFFEPLKAKRLYVAITSFMSS
ncbi:hypothetical protein UlMin_045549 [Ulmus minor]